MVKDSLKRPVSDLEAPDSKRLKSTDTVDPTPVVESADVIAPTPAAESTDVDTDSKRMTLFLLMILCLLQWILLILIRIELLSHSFLRNLHI